MLAAIVNGDGPRTIRTCASIPALSAGSIWSPLWY